MWDVFLGSKSRHAKNRGDRSVNKKPDHEDVTETGIIPLSPVNIVRSKEITYDVRDMKEIAAECNTVEEFLGKFCMTEEEVKTAERVSRGQSENPVWFKLRRGRLTASNFYRIHTRMDKMKNKKDVDCNNLIKSLIDPVSIENLPSIKHGKLTEPKAAKRVQAAIESQEGHKNVRVESCGLFIDHDKQYLAGSPDGLVFCDCCSEPRLLEIKCPTREISKLEYLDTEKKLKSKTSYYGQVQGQMVVTHRKESYFFVYKSDEDWNLQLIEYDEVFCQQMLRNLKKFYVHHFAPKLIEN